MRKRTLVTYAEFISHGRRLDTRRARTLDQVCPLVDPEDWAALGASSVLNGFDESLNPSTQFQ